MTAKTGVRAKVRWAVAGVAAAALVVSGCGQIPETGMNPAAVPAAPTTGEVGAAVELAPDGEETPEPTPKELPTPKSRRTATPKVATSVKATPTPSLSPKPTQPPGPAIMKAGQTSERIKELQARLDQIGWFSGSITGHYGSQTTTAVAGFQAKRTLPDTGQVDQATWDSLLKMTRKPTAAELSNEKATPTPTSTPSKATKGGDIDERCKTGRVICISKGANTLRWMHNGNVLMTMDVRFGTSEYPTREGVFSVQWKSRDHVSTLYHSPMPYALFFSGGQAVHYSPDFAARGYNGGSHGCVNLRNKAGAESLFNQAQVGDKVIVYR